MDLLPLILAVSFSLIASFSDIKKREIADSLNFGAFGLAVVLNVLYVPEASFLLARFLPFISLAFLFSFLLYRVGAWAGGDVKFFTALAAFYPLLNPLFSFYSFFSIFLFSVLLLVPVMLLIYMPRIAPYASHLQELLKQSLFSSLNASIFSYVVLIVLSFVFFFFPDSPLLLILVVLLLYFLDIPLAPSIVLFVIFWFMYGLELELYLFLFAIAFAASFFTRTFSLLSTHVLRVTVPIKHVKEGMIPSETVVQKGKRVYRFEPLQFRSRIPIATSLFQKGHSISQVVKILLGTPLQGRVIVSALKARGVTPREIKALKRAGLKHLVVRESMPFAPLLSVGFLAATSWDILWHLGLR
ncbi:prepilin peptidase [Candidatus Micrarchaeota archaeon]|nr:prepilin peptidase [Candidatus Micrarchaeota archaeon]